MAPKRRSRGAALALLVGAAVAIAACGNSVSRILSTVGAPVGSTPAGAPAPSAAPGDDGQGQPGGGEPPSALRDEARIVYTGSLVLVVEDLAAALATARSAVAELDGYVGASRESNDGNSPTATLTFRIPAARWDQGVARLRTLAAKVVRESTEAVEVTGQLIDLEARIRNLRASETALQGIAANTAKVSDLLEVQRELTNVRGEIERLDAERAQLVDQTAYGTLVTTFGLEIVAVREAAEGWDPEQEVDRASASLVSVLQSLTTAGIWFVIVWLPILVAAGLFLALARFAVRRSGLLRRPPPIQGWPPAA